MQNGPLASGVTKMRWMSMILLFTVGILSTSIVVLFVLYNNEQIGIFNFLALSLSILGPSLIFGAIMALLLSVKVTKTEVYDYGVRQPIRKIGLARWMAFGFFLSIGIASKWSVSLLLLNLHQRDIIVDIFQRSLKYDAMGIFAIAVVFLYKIIAESRLR